MISIKLYDPETSERLPLSAAQRAQIEALPEDATILINLSHPLTEQHLATVERLSEGKPVELLIKLERIPFADQAELEPQARELVNSLGLTPHQWQNLDIVINPPALASAGCVLMAELHARMGHFPRLIRIRPVANTVLTRYEVGQVINLQRLRAAGRNGHGES